MLKAAGRTGDGRPMVVIGLTGENITRLMADEPITFSLTELNSDGMRMPDVQVVVIAAQDMQRLLDLAAPGQGLKAEDFGDDEG